MRILFWVLCVAVMLPLSANADMDDYYKYVDQYDKDRNNFLDLKERAEAGDVASQSELGTVYFEGRPPGLQQNLKKAYKWWQKAADNGDAEAQYRMSFFISEGMSDMMGVEGDNKKAFKYLEESAESGHRDSQKMLAGILVEGSFIADKKDIVDAYKWAGLALGEGEDLDEEVEELINGLENMMTSAEVRRAKGVLKRAINKRDAGKGGMGAYERNR